MEQSHKPCLREVIINLISQESAKSLVEVPLASASSNTVANGFNPEAVIAIGNVTVGITANISESLLMSIGKMIRHAL